MPYVRNAWYVCAWSHEIDSDRLAGVGILGEPIVIWRNRRGELAAFEDRCAHRLAPLSLGRCEGETLRCMYHGLLYDRGGRVVEIPGQNRLTNSLKLRAYPIVDRHSWVWVWMGDAGAADESLIPAVVGLDHKGFSFWHSQLDYAAAAQLVNENLLDLTHVSFLHRDSFRMNESWGRARPRVTQRKRSVFIEWWIRNQPRMASLDTSQPPVDTYLAYDFHVPGVLLMTAGTFPVGTADALGGEAPDLEQSQVGRSLTCQAITPVAARSTRYFYSMGSDSRKAGDAQALREEDMAVTHKAFAEDRMMIEGQQRIIDATPGWRFRYTSADRGILTFNRLVERLACEEAARIGQPSDEPAPGSGIETADSAI